MTAHRRSLSHFALYTLIVSSGFATLSWEVLWQIKSTLALGVSAWGTAITLAVTMGGMSLGGFLMGQWLRHGSRVEPLRIYGGLEFFIGVSGLLLTVAFQALEGLDSWAYQGMASAASWVHILGIILVLGVPTVCMGATLPVFGLVARQFNVSIASLYGFNTLGAAAGVLFAALVLIPLLGIGHTIWFVAGINMLVGAVAWACAPGGRLAALPDGAPAGRIAFSDMFIVFVTGFATFVLEIAWFRSLATTLPNNTDVFAIMLACMLIALGLASRKVPQLRQAQKPLAVQLCMAGILILLTTPLIEHFISIILLYSPERVASAMKVGTLLDANTYRINSTAVALYALHTLIIFFATFCVIVPPVRFLGVAFPWIIDGQSSSRSIGRLYAINTFAAIIGALGTTWVLLPTIGFGKTAWLAGGLVIAAGMLITAPRRRLVWALAGMAALGVAVNFEMGDARMYVQGAIPAKILEFFEGPEATVSVVEYDDGGRRLYIDSSSASAEAGSKYKMDVHYMTWMGHLPMLVHPDPEKALIICFGTGQTTNAVRREDPESVDVVDINPRIFKLSHNFKSNEGVLNDPRVKAIVMDGRAYMRRTGKVYDVITLEPMPPTNAGVNALYSREFYAAAKAKLGEKGVIAQWLPFHDVAPHYAASIAKTFISEFPNAVLWVDPDSTDNGILLGSKDEAADLMKAWPGFKRMHANRNLAPAKIQTFVVLDRDQLKRYGDYGEMITDDNQLLAYGAALYSYKGLSEENAQLLERVVKEGR